MTQFCNTCHPRIATQGRDARTCTELREEGACLDRWEGHPLESQLLMQMVMPESRNVVLDFLGQDQCRSFGLT